MRLIPDENDSPGVCWWCAKQAAAGSLSSRIETEPPLRSQRGARDGWWLPVIAMVPSRTHYCRRHLEALVQLGGDDFGPLHVQRAKR